jgi:hypothetical protein
VPPDFRCHYCASPFQYDAWKWNKKKQAFAIYRHLNGDKSWSDSAAAFKGDWAFIQSALKR